MREWNNLPHYIVVAGNLRCFKAKINSYTLIEGLIFGGAYIRRGYISMEGNLRFKIDWASLLVGRKFTVFALF